MEGTNYRLSYTIKKVKWFANKSKTEFFIFSGKFGLLHENTPIPWYDKILKSSDLEGMIIITVKQLMDYGIKTVDFYGRPQTTAGWELYYVVIEQACERAGILINKRIIE